MLTVDPTILKLFDEAAIAERQLVDFAGGEEIAETADLINNLNRQWPYTHATLTVTGEAYQVTATSGYSVQLVEAAPDKLNEQAVTSLGFAMYRLYEDVAPRLGLIFSNSEQRKLYIASRNDLAIDYPFQSVEFMSKRAKYFMPEHTEWIDRVCEQPQAHAEDKVLALAGFRLPGTASGETAGDVTAYLSERLDLDGALPYIASYKGRYFTFDANDSSTAVARLAEHEIGCLVTQPSPFFVRRDKEPGELELCVRANLHQADKERAPIDVAIPIASLGSFISCRRIAADAGN